jgi:hypothetical protein
VRLTLRNPLDDDTRSRTALTLGVIMHPAPEQHAAVQH